MPARPTLTVNHTLLKGIDGFIFWDIVEEVSMNKEENKK